MLMSRPSSAGIMMTASRGQTRGADVAFQAQNLVQTQLHRIDEQLQRQFQLRGGFAFDDPGFHVTLKSYWFTQFYVRILSTVAAGFSLRLHRLRRLCHQKYLYLRGAPSAAATNQRKLLLFSLFAFYPFRPGFFPYFFFPSSFRWYSRALNFNWRRRRLTFTSGNCTRSSSYLSQGSRSGH